MGGDGKRGSLDAKFLDLGDNRLCSAFSTPLWTLITPSIEAEAVDSGLSTLKVPTVFRSPQGGRGKGHQWARLGQREGRASGPGDGWSSILAGKVPKKGYASAFLSETDPFSLGNPAVYQGNQN